MKRVILFLIITIITISGKADGYYIITDLDDPNLLGTWGVYEASSPNLPYKFVFDEAYTLVYSQNLDGKYVPKKYLSYFVSGNLTGRKCLHFVGSASYGANGFEHGWLNYIVKHFDGSEMIVSDYSETYTLKLRKDFDPPVPDYVEPIEYVDLGLSVLWATCNLGASSPYDSGNYYAWGETKPKNIYNESTYTPNWDSMPNHIAGTQYDPAHVELGHGWHIPQYNDFVELINNCTWEYSETDHGYYVTGPNGNQIFFPFVGGKEEDYTVGYNPGYYWGQGFYMSDSKSSIDLYNFYLYMDKDPRYGMYQYLVTRGQCIRPVKASSNVAQIISDNTEGCVNVYNVAGQLEFINVPIKDLKDILTKGIHVINGHKLLIE